MAVLPHSAKTCRTLILETLGSLVSLAYFGKVAIKFVWYEICRPEKIIPEVDSGTLSCLK